MSFIYLATFSTAFRDLFKFILILKESILFEIFSHYFYMMDDDRFRPPFGFSSGFFGSNRRYEQSDSIGPFLSPISSLLFYFSAHLPQTRSTTRKKRRHLGIWEKTYSGDFVARAALEGTAAQGVIWRTFFAAQRPCFITWIGCFEI